jgi:hypothetical protein
MSEYITDAMAWLVANAFDDMAGNSLRAEAYGGYPDEVLLRTGHKALADALAAVVADNDKSLDFKVGWSVGYQEAETALAAAPAVADVVWCTEWKRIRSKTSAGLYRCESYAGLAVHGVCPGMHYDLIARPRSEETP